MCESGFPLKTSKGRNNFPDAVTVSATEFLDVVFVELQILMVFFFPFLVLGVIVKNTSV
jgi:hypothetical protein